MKRHDYLKIALVILFGMFLELQVSNAFSFPSFYSGLVAIAIAGSPEITIFNPQNITYNFSKSDLNYTIPLNVSANQPVSLWWYDHFDLKHNRTVKTGVFFAPNISINATRWLNDLVVYMNDSEGQVYSKEIAFFVYVPNSAPIMDNISRNIYVCEDRSLSYFFNTLDVDEDALISNINPKNPFYVFPLVGAPTNITLFEIVSGTLSKSSAGGVNAGWKVYHEAISVSDGVLSDTKNTNITVIEINHAPVLNDVGAKTLWTHGDNSTLYEQVNSSDIEDGDQNSGNLSFNISFDHEFLFNISNLGVINFTANPNLTGNYVVNICSTDRGLENPSPNISICGQNGSSFSICRNFSLTITNQNRPPTIISHSPVNTSLIIVGTDDLRFSVNSYDPDGTVVDVYWIVDGKVKKYSPIAGNDSLDYSFGCDSSGIHQVSAVVSDGLLNDSVSWVVSVGLVACSSSGGSGGGGGGGGGAGCHPKWGCSDWGLCQNAKTSLQSGILSGDDYRAIQDECATGLLNESSCGFQIRKCTDINNCNSTFDKSAEVQGCLFSENPSCSDRIKNCHDGGCEFLVDCGGPCLPCPSCSDGIKNQGEDDVDCGGPCPNLCKEVPSKISKGVNYALIAFLSLFSLAIVILLGRVIFMLIRIRQKKEEEDKEKEE